MIIYQLKLLPSSFVSIRMGRHVHHSRILYVRTRWGHFYIFGDRMYTSLIDLVNEERCMFKYPLFTKRFEKLFPTNAASSNSAATSSPNSNYEVPSQMYIYGVPVAAIVDGPIKNKK